MTQNPKSEDDRNSKAQNVPAMEWIFSGLGAIMACVIIASTLYHGIRSTSSYPELSVAVEHVETTKSGYLVVFKALNSGDVTAARVTVEGQLIRDGQIIETVSLMLNFVPAQSGSGGAMLFENDPGELELRIRAVSYTDP